MEKNIRFEDKKLVVFGAGYVGGVLAREAVAKGMRVQALTRNAARACELEAAGVETIVAELSSEEWHGKIAPADFIVNCAGAGGGGVEGFRKSYVGGMKSIVAWMRRQFDHVDPVDHVGGKGKFVYTSSTSVYPQSGGAIVREGDEAGEAGSAEGTRGADRAENDERTRLLLDAERVALGAGACVLRLAGIYGPGRHALLDRMRAGAAMLPGRADSRLNLIHRDDAAAAIWAALEREDTGGEIFNVCDDAPCLRGEVVEWLARRLGVEAPAFSGVVARGGRDRVISNEKLKTRTNWRPRFASFREGYGALLGG